MGLFDSLLEGAIEGVVAGAAAGMVATAVAAPNAEAAAQPIVLQEQQLPQWQCEYCRSMNKGEDLSCTHCGAPMPNVAFN